MSYFGDRPDLEVDAMSKHVPLSGTTIQQTGRGYWTEHTIPKPLSFLRPMTPYGDTYTPSYTRYLNAPSNSYVNPLHTLFNDRRPQPSKIRSTLFPQEGD